MNFRELVNRIFKEFAIDAVVSHSLAESSRSACLRGSRDLIMFTRVHKGKAIVGVRGGSVADPNSHQGYFWVFAGTDELEIWIAPEMNNHCEHMLMNAIIRRLGELEKELDFRSPALNLNCLVPPKPRRFPGL